MAELQKAPTVPDGMIPKILKALDAGFVPGTTEYFQALGASAKDRGLMASSDLPPIISGLRDKFSRDAQKLSQEQHTLQEVGMGMLKQMSEHTAQLKSQQDFDLATAPPRPIAQQSFPGAFPSPMQEGMAYGPGAPTPVEYSPGVMMTPGLGYSQEELQQPTALYGTKQEALQRLYDSGSPAFFQEGQRPVAMEEMPNAPLAPWEVQRLKRLQGGHTVVEEDTGRELPTALAKPRTDLMSPEEFGYGLKFLDKSGFLPDGLRAGDYELPQAPIPRTEGTAMLNGLRTAATQTANDRTTMNRIANAHYGKDFNDLPKGGREQQDVVKRYALMQPLAQQQVMLSTPVTPEVGETLFDRKAFEETGELVPRPDVSNATARSKEVVRISEKNMDTLQEVEKSAVSLDQIFDYSKRIVTAKTPTQAALQAARYAANSNPMTRMVPGVYDAQMASYYDMVEALGNGLAKAFGGERGVLTNVDVKRWVNALPKPGDTVEVRGVKETALRRLAQAAAIAQRRAISGDRGETKKLREDMHSTMDNILKPLEEQGKPPAPKKSPEDRYNELSKSGMKDAAIYKQMATEGY